MSESLIERLEHIDELWHSSTVENARRVAQDLAALLASWRELYSALESISRQGSGSLRGLNVGARTAFKMHTEQADEALANARKLLEKE